LVAIREEMPEIITRHAVLIIPTDVGNPGIVITHNYFTQAGANRVIRRGFGLYMYE